MIPDWAHSLAAGLLFTACVALPALIPLTAPLPRTPQQPTSPSWARTRAQARHYTLTHTRPPRTDP
ncbi:hypothetical protein AB0958_19000 [Streptomyces sp. NPDC006655]|uniref:hypothetical protein n=1 Tax=Streptomyces sp. NPDC006655 TaxID=3156898 RepID=UPI003452B557